MRLLLDTHCWLWMRGEPERLSEANRQLVRSPETSLFLSAVAAWEIAIKFAAGKLRLPQPPSVYVTQRLAEDRLAALPILHSHALRAGELPLHHRDPFDRMLIAQAQIEGLTLLTADRHFAAYDVPIQWA
ncbi:MAG TPA: type II toxin-antitoxin system VapC family toxin [Thermoanaerobaculia bacterium]|nr:type II toxin-antitoxin system VapC family toxin [Thermoanaerobaculia bacterium]